MFNDATLKMLFAASEQTPLLTSAQTLHSQLRTEIISLKRRPGEPINEKEIASEHGVSRTPVREALLRLTSEKLVEIIPKSGTIVSRIPVAVLPEAIVARTALELVTVRAAAERAERSGIASLRTILEMNREKQQAGDKEGFHTTDEALHQMIVQIAGYPAIWSFIEHIKIQLDRYRHLTLPQPHRMEHATQEHAEIIDAIAEHNPARAARAMKFHLDGLALSLASIRDINPDYFTGDTNLAYEKWETAGVMANMASLALQPLSEQHEDLRDD